MLVWDAHFCLPLHPDADWSPLEKLRARGVHYVSVNVGMDFNPPSQIMAVLAAFRRNITAASERFLLAQTVADVYAARDSGRLAVGFDLEGAMPLMERPEMVFLYRDMGVRQIHFAYNRNNSIAGGCHDVAQGLSALGRKMVAAVNQAGLLMDCSHTGRRCSLDIMEASQLPVIFSHANPLALVEHGRNISDEQICAAAASGGVVCVSGVSAFVGKAKPSADEVARHAAYVAEIAGVEHVGIGLDIVFRQSELDDSPPPPFDIDYWWPPVAGYRRGFTRMEYVSVDAYRQLPAALARVGMSDNEIAGVMGGNMARVADCVWSSS